MHRSVSSLLLQPAVVVVVPYCYYYTISGGLVSTVELSRIGIARVNWVQVAITTLLPKSVSTCEFNPFPGGGSCLR